MTFDIIVDIIFLYCKSKSSPYHSLQWVEITLGMKTFQRLNPNRHSNLILSLQNYLIIRTHFVLAHYKYI